MAPGNLESRELGIEEECVYVCVLTRSYLKKVAEGERIQCDLLCVSVQKRKKKKRVGMVISM